MQAHPDQSDEPPRRSRRRLLAGVLVGLLVAVLVLLHLLGVIHG